MKNLTIIVVALFVTLTGCAKNPETGYKKFYRQYCDAPNTITFKIPGKLAGMFIDVDDEEAKDFIKKMNSISFFVANKTTKQMIIDLNKNMPENLYKEIMVINEGNTEIVFLAHDNGDTIQELVMTVYEPDELVIICMNGEFTYNDARKIAKSINTENAIKIGN